MQYSNIRGNFGTEIRCEPGDSLFDIDVPENFRKSVMKGVNVALNILENDKTPK